MATRAKAATATFAIPKSKLYSLAYKYAWLTALFVILSGLYVWISLATPPDKATLVKYRVSQGSLTILTLTVIVPYIIIALIALIGCLRLKDYTNSIKDTKDGGAFNQISNGIIWLAAWIPVSGLVGAATSYYYRNHPRSTPLMVHLNLYITLALLAIGFWLAYEGSRKLLKIVKRTDQVLIWGIIGMITFAALYTFMSLHDVSRQLPVHGVRVATYYLPDWLIVITVVIPRLIMWFLGFQAAYNIFIYSSRVKGKIYKSGVKELAIGIAGVVVATAFLRILQSLSSTLNKLSLGAVLLLVYILLILIGVGYAYISKGARNLQKIEEI